MAYPDSYLPRLAKRYLSTPPSSIFSERMFSQAGNIYTEKRNHLSPELADKLLFLHHNLQIYDLEKAYMFNREVLRMYDVGGKF